MSEEQIQRIKDRYFRKVIAHPEGAIVHYGDCHIYGNYVCHCGLHADLQWIDYEEAIKLYPKYEEECLLSEIRLDQIRELPKPVYVPPTPEEIAACDKMLEEMFGKYAHKREDKL